MNATTRIGHLDVSRSQTNEGLALTLTGTADLSDSKELATHLIDAHQQALAAKSARVLVDVCAVEFMNSTALGAFVSWVAQLQQTAAAQRYRIVFKGTGQRRWQRGSLHALASFAPDHISVELA
jgi:hypothetical protein